MDTKLETLVDLLLLNNAEIEKLRGAIPSIKDELSATLAQRLTELSAEAEERTKADVRLRQVTLAKEVESAARSAASENANRIKGELSAETSRVLETITAEQRLKVAELSPKISELDTALKTAGKIHGDLVQLAEKQFAQLLLSHSTKIAEIEPKVLALARAAASQVTREYSEKHSVPELVKKEFAALSGGTLLIDSFKGDWTDGKIYSRGDILAFRGATYIALRATKRGEFPSYDNQTSRNPAYQVLAAAGAPGPKGQDGAGSGGSGTEITAASAAGAANRFWVSGGADRTASAVSAATARLHLNVAAQAVSASEIDWNLGPTHTKTLGADTTFTFANDSDGEVITVAVTNTASNYTVTWPGGVLWSGGAAPTQTTGAKTDVYTFMKIGSTVYGSAVQNFG